MSKIIHAGSNKKLEPFKTEQYSYIERGEKGFTMPTFDKNSISVQDMVGQPKAPVELSRPAGGRRSLFGNFDDSALTSGTTENKYSFLDFLADKSEERTGTGANEHQPAEHHQTVIIDHDGFQEVDLSQSQVSMDDVNVPSSQKRLAEQNAEMKALSDKLTAEQAKVSELENHLSALSVEKDALQVALDETAAKLKSAEGEGLIAAKKDGVKEGYDKAKTEFDAKEMKQYEVQKKDYMQTLEKNWVTALAEIAKINDTINEVDKEMPEIIIGYVRQLVGAERKLNDNVITGVVSAALGKLKDLQQIVFTVNPDDAGIIAEKFPQYGVAIDPSIPKGGVKIRTKVGDIDISVDSWMDGLEKQINEQFAATQKH